MSSSSSASESTTDTKVEEQIVLACEVPENATPGSTFHVQLENRFFEVTTPENAIPGQTIHIIVPSEAATAPMEGKTVSTSPQVIYVSEDLPGDPNVKQGVFTQLRTLGDRAVAHAKTLDDKYKITDKVGEIAKPAVEKIKQVDEKYKVTETASSVGSQARAKLTELDEKYEISNKASALVDSTYNKIQEIGSGSAANRVVGYAREIDSKYAVSATAARFVEAGTKVIVGAYNKAVEFDQQHQLSERAAATVAAGAHAVANQVSKLSGSRDSADGANTENAGENDANKPGFLHETSENIKSKAADISGVVQKKANEISDTVKTTANEAGGTNA